MKKNVNNNLKTRFEKAREELRKRESKAIEMKSKLDAAKLFYPIDKMEREVQSLEHRLKELHEKLEAFLAGHSLVPTVEWTRSAMLTEVKDTGN
jgi:predicted  nucleic acid-binding Zn-ribbon protein